MSDDSLETPVADAAPVTAEGEPVEGTVVVAEAVAPAPRPVPVPPPPLTDPTLARLQGWAQVAYEIGKLAQSLANTNFVPSAMRKKPAEVAAAILTGAELGLDPMASLRSIVVIQGTPTLTATAMRALVNAAGHRVRIIEADAEHAIVHGWRKGEFDGPPHVSEWTQARAKGLGLLTKDNWRNMPQNMYVARASSEVCRWTAPDALTSVPYSAEEIADEHDLSLGKPKRSRVKRPAPAIPEPEAIPPDVADAVEVDAAVADAP